jgi:cytochrome c6
VLSKKLLAIGLSVILVVVLSLGMDLPVQAANLANGEQVFNVHCVGCHVQGGNIVRRGKTLKKKALQRNHFDTLEAIAAIVANGKNNMSAYQDRLTAQQIQDVAAYVLDQADRGWR